MPPPSDYDSIYEGDKSNESAAHWDNDTPDESSELDLDFLRAHPSAAMPRSPFERPSGPEPPSPWSANSSTFQSSAAVHTHTSFALPLSANALHFVTPLSRSASDPESSLDGPRFTDPSQYPNPYPFRPMAHLSSGPPALSSAGSSSASTRSSAYTSAGSAGEYGHIYVASSDLEGDLGVASSVITSDSVAQLMEREIGGPSMQTANRSRAPTRRTQWSSSSPSSRSRPSSSSRGHHTHNAAEGSYGTLRPRPSFDDSWQPDERDEVGLTSDDDLDDDESPEVDEATSDERTAAVVLAEEGRGLIVRGDNISLGDLRVGPGTTHLLLGQSVTPNSMPSFLNNTLPQICDTLLALDISANFLVALPPAVASCTLLEELNIASNPLRALPIFLSNLSSLRVLIADATGLTTLPAQLSTLERLNTLSIRRNKLYSLPSWLYLLGALETLLVDGNPFQGPWHALLQPLMAKIPTTPFYPPSTPFFTRSVTAYSSLTTSDAEPEEGTEPPSTLEEEHTITPATASAISAPPLARKLERTRTTPSRSYHDRNSPISPIGVSVGRGVTDSGYFGDTVTREIRRMRSAGEMRRSPELSSAPVLPTLEPVRPALMHYATSASSSNLLSLVPDSDTGQAQAQKRFATLSLASGSPKRQTGAPSRPALGSGLFEILPSNGNPEISKGSSSGKTLSSRSRPTSPVARREAESIVRIVKEEEKEKQGRWGFLKKMSMAKMKPDPSAMSRPAVVTEVPPRAPSVVPRLSTPSLGESELLPLSASGPHVLSSGPSSILSTSRSSDVVTSITAPSSSCALLAPPSPSGIRSGKRRSFLPIDGPAPLSIPNNIPFTEGLVVAFDADEEVNAHSPATPDGQEFMRREEERAREANARALRSVIAYLRDMYDLGLSSQKQNGGNLQGSSSPSTESGIRSRRPTVGEGSRVLSDGSISSLSNSPSISQSPSTTELRSKESLAHLHNGDFSNTVSVASTDSNRSSGSEIEERKYKDDKAKRAVKVREIIETERTYVKCLQELVDIYVKPAAANVNLLGSREPLVPPAERKLVFNGVDALFSFHKDSFLPALERAAAPLLASPKAVAESDFDGQQSINVVNAVARVFLSHSAFMKMYSTYINNFDNAVQRVRYWNSSSSNKSTPSSSTAQLAGLGLSMSGMSAGVSPEATVAGLTPLSGAQRKRIKSYLKRCRLSPHHSQLNLEGYLLLPVQRVPRYRMLLNELVTSTPPEVEYMDNPLERALTDISSLATNMNEGKREAEARRMLVHWQSRIRGKFPSPLVQPHRRFIMDGGLHLTRVVRKSSVSFDVVNAQGDISSVQVECLAPELTPRSLIGVLCNDLLVLCRDGGDSKDAKPAVDLWAVLRMQTLPQPASIVHGNTLRLVDNKAILYFEIPSTAADALTWSRAINIHIPASKA